MNLNNYLSVLFEDEDVAEPTVIKPLKPVKFGSGDKSHRRFIADVYWLAKYEGGKGQPVFAGYRPWFDFGVDKVRGTIKLPEGIYMVMPGDNIEIEVRLVKSVMMKLKIKFHIFGGMRLVAAGVVKEFVD